MAMVIQVKLKGVDSNEYLVTWLDMRKPIRTGSVISFKNSLDKRWEVIEMYDLSMDSTKIHQDWDNNI
jgi:hypothetical protein